MKTVLISAVGLVWLMSCPTVQSAPPEYATFGREQRLDYTPNPSELLRIWVVYVNQGDGLLIQLPPKYSDDSDERIDIVVDGGSNPSTQAWRLTDFIRRLYGSEPPKIDYAVITHHDQDHVAGMTSLLGEADFSFDTVYHNGLASYRGGKRGFPANQRPPNSVYKFESGHLTRGLAKVKTSGELDASYLIETLADLRTARNAAELQGIYDALAKAVIDRADDGELTAFTRAHQGAPFISEREFERGRIHSNLTFKVLWPLNELRSYGGNDWGETINGNSVTFRLAYKNFTMVFTGDHNEKSEPKLLEDLRARNQLGLLDCDVFKVPHHGSSHAYEEFFKRSGFNPVVSVASMGEKGFQSKQVRKSNWQHPDTKVIGWLGGFHRVYHTFIHEQAFRWEDITDAAARERMVELSHILIETDGEWFRLVEVPASEGAPLIPATVKDTRRGNGTRWIRTRQQP